MVEIQIQCCVIPSLKTKKKKEKERKERKLKKQSLQFLLANYSKKVILCIYFSIVPCNRNRVLTMAKIVEKKTHITTPPNVLHKHKLDQCYLLWQVSCI